MKTRIRLDAKDVEIDEETIKLALMRPDSFGLSPNHPHYDDLFVTWSLGPVIATRDSKLMDQSNSAALLAHLKTDPTLKNDWMITTCDHFGCGWVEHLSFRAVIKRTREPTRIFRVLQDWNNALQSYPVADDSDYSRREYEAACENIRTEGTRFLNGTEPEKWWVTVFSWLWVHNQNALENNDDEGAYPSEDSLKKCIKALGWLSKDYEEEDHE